MTFFLIMIPVWVFAVSLAGSPIFQAFDGDGLPLSGGKLYTYEVGSTTPKTTYQDKDSAAAHTNPIILDSRGEAEIWWNGAYKLILKDSSDTTIWTVDNFQGTGIYVDSVSATSGYVAISAESGTSSIRFIPTLSGVSITDATITDAKLTGVITKEIATTSPISTTNTVTARSKHINLPLGTYTTLALSSVSGVYVSAVSDASVSPTSGASCVLSSPTASGYDVVFILENQTSIAGTSIYVAFTSGDIIASADTITAGTSKFVMSGTTDSQLIWCHSTGVSRWYVRTNGSPTVDWD